MHGLGGGFWWSKGQRPPRPRPRPGQHGVSGSGGGRRAGPQPQSGLCTWWQSQAPPHQHCPQQHHVACCGIAAQLGRSLRAQSECPPCHSKWWVEGGGTARMHISRPSHGVAGRGREGQGRSRRPWKTMEGHQQTITGGAGKGREGHGRSEADHHTEGQGRSWKFMSRPAHEESSWKVGAGQHTKSHHGRWRKHEVWLDRGMRGRAGLADPRRSSRQAASEGLACDGQVG